MFPCFIVLGCHVVLCYHIIISLSHHALWSHIVYCHVLQCFHMSLLRWKVILEGIETMCKAGFQVCRTQPVISVFRIVPDIHLV